jgi:hypothetical protein
MRYACEKILDAGAFDVDFLHLRVSLMTKTLCDLLKLLETNPKRYLRLVRDPTHLCLKCGRVANDKQRLCRPAKIRSA